MKARAPVFLLIGLLAAFTISCERAPARSSESSIDRDLLEVTIPQLEDLYRAHRYTVTEVVKWHIARAQKYNGIYGATQNFDEPGALAAAPREDAEASAGGANFVRGPLWGVPIVTKANTSVQGLVTTDGWKGYKIPSHELVAPKDATIVRKLRAAGVIIIAKPICLISRPAIPIEAPLMAVPETPMTCASAPAVPQVARSRRLLRITPC